MFAKRLKKLRKEKKLTQEELGKLFSMQNTAISKYELGERKPDQETLVKLAKFFDVTTDYLLGESDIRNPYKVDEKINEFTSGDIEEFIIRENESKYLQVSDVEEAMEIILDQPGLMLKGELLSDESKIILANAIQMGLRTAEEIEKKKNKGDSNE